mgnify:CR=1 FL=1
MISVVGIAFDYGVEMTYPVGQSYSTGLLLCAGTVFGNSYTLIGGYLIDQNGQDGSK